MCGLELGDVTIDCLRRKEVAERDVRFEPARVDLAVPRGTVVQRLDLAGEVDRATQDGIEQRLLAEPIAREEQLAPPSIPHGKRKHPVEARDASLAPFLV